MRSRMTNLRTQFADAVHKSTLPASFATVQSQKGMFSILDISAAQITALRSAFSLYMPDSGRINVAGLNSRNIPYVIDALTRV